MITDSNKGNDLARCPKCGATLSGFALLTGRENAHPRDGSLTICAYCRASLAFCADLTVRLATKQESKNIAAEDVFKLLVEEGHEAVKRCRETMMMIERPDDMPQEMLNGIMRELVMYFVVKAGGNIEISIDEMAKLVQMKSLGVQALGDPDNQTLGLRVKDIQTKQGPVSTNEKLN